MVKCVIKFEGNPLGTFYSGSVINGKVEILLEKPMSVRAIYLIIHGSASVRWSETESVGMGKSRRTQSVTYSANDDYIYTKTYLIGISNGNTLEINSGAHIYTFSCQLPPQIPSSVESHYGRIRYTAKVTFDRPWKFDKTFKVGFTVLKTTNLNNGSRSIRLPATLQVQKIFWCWPCASKPLIVQATIPQSGYVSGQNIPVTINLFNESGRKVHHVEVSLKKILKSTSDYPSTKSKLEEITVKKMIIESIQNLPKEDMHIDFLVPAIPPTCSQTTCRIIQVYYELRVKADLPIPHISPVVVIPITIGNIPLQSQLYQSISNVPSVAPVACAPSPNTPEIYSIDFELRPPTYEEATYQERVNINDDDDKHPISESNYIPRYPVFHFEPTAPAASTSVMLETISENSKR